MIKRLFWNSTENRLRAGWRILIQIIMISVPLAWLAYRGVYSSGDQIDTRVSLTALPITLVSVYFLGRYIDKRKFSDYGLQLKLVSWQQDYAFGLLAGVLGASAYVLMLVLLGWAEIKPASNFGASGISIVAAFLISIITYAGVGVFEELLRVYQVRNITEGLAGTRLGIAGAMLAAVFLAGCYSVVMHAASGDAVFLVYVLVTGMIYGAFFLWTQRAALAMAIHFAWDFTFSSIFLLGSPGTQDATIFYVPVDGVPASGANLLPIVGLLAKFLLLGLVLMWIKRREGNIQLQEELAIPSLLPGHREPEQAADMLYR